MARTGEGLHVHAALRADGCSASISCSFRRPIIQALRAHRGYFDRTCRAWVVPLAQYRALLIQFERLDLGPERLMIKAIPDVVLRLTEHPDWQRQATQHQSFSATELLAITGTRLPRRLVHKMMPYQRAGVACAIERGGRVLWSDEMGLGKTVSSLATAAYYQAEWPLLVVCPSSLKLTWHHEICKWLQIDESAIGVVSSKKSPMNKLVTILSYDLARNLHEHLTSADFQVIIADESHYLKNGKAARTKALMPLLHKAKRVLLLSGTPALSRPIELYQQLHALAPRLFRSEVAFGIRYCNSQLTAFGWRHDGSCNQDELHCVLERLVMIRRVKAAVLTDLPPKTRQEVYVQADPAPLRALKAIMQKRKALERQLASLHGSQRAQGERALQALTTEAYGLTGEAKIKGCLRYLEDLMNHDGKLLIFAHHKTLLDELATFLCQRQLRHIRIDGSTPTHLRQQLCNSFQDDVLCRVAVLSITTAGTGLTLHAANTVVFAELYWNPGHLYQAEDRAHRVGQRHNVNVRYLLCPGTLDDVMWSQLQRKAKIVQRAMAGASTTQPKPEEPSNKRAHTNQAHGNKPRSQPDDDRCNEQHDHLDLAEQPDVLVVDEDSGDKENEASPPRHRQEPVTEAQEAPRSFEDFDDWTDAVAVAEAVEQRVGLPNPARKLTQSSPPAAVEASEFQIQAVCPLCTQSVLAAQLPLHVQSCEDVAWLEQ
ncbi:uncharacterized protein MONBRDRAFT_9161 [Monosiga brevicollis MX1]|uniref:Uncharacterized protein n=1 Tax=Monosiga brevicollis TaxID=81824 RepID=A9V2A0_MONBE|nr:uncharacterized protein MONBRDRAFT_9161 [Monosiga brevicollis MX1]EDQ88339.1 predicted protein [Monosiga brevicollis MX1]|eukprot:XP_001746932.1 hypothetical protein [Monosiga brevicollis MX1]